jgi:hypothetical protein
MDCTCCDGEGHIFIEMDDEGRSVYLSCPDCGLEPREPQPEPSVVLEDVPF